MSNFDADAEFYANAVMLRGREALEADGRANSAAMALEAANDRAERLQMQVSMLLTQVDGMRAEIARLQAQSDVDAAHAAGLVAEKDALVKEADKCPERTSHHHLVDKVNYVNGVTGKSELGRVSREVYRAAFDAEAVARGLENVESLRR